MDTLTNRRGGLVALAPSFGLAFSRLAPRRVRAVVEDAVAFIGRFGGTLCPALQHNTRGGKRAHKEG
ncbi:MAG: hypothetical protein U9O54_06955 [Chloroflexota bacterium]|nr:hypothetical protein [Chloroflexota bacterium]